MADAFAAAVVEQSDPIQPLQRQITQVENCHDYWWTEKHFHLKVRVGHRIDELRSQRWVMGLSSCGMREIHPDLWCYWIDHLSDWWSYLVCRSLDIPEIMIWLTLGKIRRLPVTNLTHQEVSQYPRRTPNEPICPSLNPAFMLIEHKHRTALYHSSLPFD